MLCICCANVFKCCANVCKRCAYVVQMCGNGVQMLCIGKQFTFNRPWLSPPINCGCTCTWVTFTPTFHLGHFYPNFAPGSLLPQLGRRLEKFFGNICIPTACCKNSCIHAIGSAGNRWASKVTVGYLHTLRHKVEKTLVYMQLDILPVVLVT